MSSPADAGGPAAALRAAGALVYVADVEAPELGADDVHHLLGVLRLRRGEQIALADGQGRFRFGALGAGATRPVGRPRSLASEELFESLGAVEFVERPEPACCVAFALSKGERAEWTVQKLTELGVDRIIPLLTRRTVVRLDGAGAEKRGERLRRVAREAGAQSRQPCLPEVFDPLPFPSLLSLLGPAGLETAALAEPGARGLSLDTTTLVVGPEGGWAEDELRAVPNHVALGTPILRAETAALVAAVHLVSRRLDVAR